MNREEVLPDIDFSGYIGEWVVICEDKVIAHDKDITKISSAIDGCKRAPTIAKIPKEETLIF